MSLEAYPVLFTEPGVWAHVVRLLGTGASVPTKEYGRGITVTRTGAGAYTLTWAENPGTFVGVTWGWSGATPSGQAGYGLVSDTFDTATLALPIVVTDAADAPADLAATQYLTLVALFKTTAV